MNARSSIVRSAVAPALLFCIGLLLFPVSGSDDKYITYWSAHALTTQGEIVNYNGERVEQSSSLTHVVVLAALATVIPISMPALGWFVSVFAGVATAFAVQRLARRLTPDLAWSAGLLTGSSVSLVYWSFGGLESSLAALLGVAVLLSGLTVLESGATPKSLLAAALFTTLFAGVRPEASFIATATWLGVLAVALVRKTIRPDAAAPDETAAHARRAAILLGLALVAFAGLVAFRWVYFHDVFPQPVHAKVGGPDLHTLRLGLTYWVVEPWTRWDPILWILAPAGIVAVLWQARRADRGLAPGVLALFCAAQLGFVSASGGDWMEAGRFLAPIVPVAAVLAAWTVRAWLTPRTGRVVIAAIVAAQMIACVMVARNSSFSGPLWARSESAGSATTWTWFDTKNRLHAQMIPLTDRLKALLATSHRQDGRPLVVFSGQMGFVPYHLAREFFGRVRFVDKGGLTTTDVTRLASSRPPEHTRTGVVFRYIDLLRWIEQPGSKPDWIPPDVVFDYELTAGPDSRRQPRLEEHGYAITFRLAGFPSAGSSVLPGAGEWRDMFIAVHRDVAPPPLTLDTFRFGR